MKALRAPGPPLRDLFSVIRELKHDRMALFTRLSEQYGDVVSLNLPGRKIYLLSNADHIQEVLQKNHRNYRKSILFNVERQRGLGDSLLTNEGDSWLQQRRLVQPAFSTESLDALVPAMVEVTERTLNQWAPLAARGEEVELAHQLTRMTIEVAGKTLFGVDLADQADALIGTIAELIHITVARMSAIAKVPVFVPTRANRRFRRELAVLDDIIYGVIHERRKKPIEGADVLSRMLVAKDPETFATMNDKQLRDEVITFLIAGHESTASGLAWTMYLLAQHPQMEQRVREEVLRVAGERPLVAADLAKMDFTRRVVQESLRLFPPSWLFDREAIADDVVGGYAIPKGATVLVLPWIQHRREKYWKKPTEFDPDRFCPENEKSRPAYAYCPFGGGPRVCIGNRFALLESQVMIGSLVRRYAIRLKDGQDVTPFPLIALRPKHGLRAVLTPHAVPQNRATTGS